MESDIKTSEGAEKPRPNWAWRAALLLVGVGVLAVLYVLFVASTKPDIQGGYSRYATGAMAKLAVIDEAPAMPTGSLQDGDGAETSLAAYQGEIVLLNLWATWCAPCIEEMPTLGALQREYEGRLRVIPVSVDSVAKIEEAETMLAELSENSLPFLVEPSRAILFAVGAPGMPVTILYDRQGRELARLAGGADWNSPEAHALIDAALSEQ